MKKENIKTCATCKFWKTDQIIFNFDHGKGVCLGNDKSNNCYLVDKNNHRHNNDYSVIPGVFASSEINRPLILVTDSDFGCVNHST